MYEEKKERIIQEFVPGKQVTLAHVIPHPVDALYAKMGLIDAEPLGSLPSLPARLRSLQQMWPAKPQTLKSDL